LFRSIKDKLTPNFFVLENFEKGFVISIILWTLPYKKTKVLPAGKDFLIERGSKYF